MSQYDQYQRHHHPHAAHHGHGSAPIGSTVSSLVQSQSQQQPPSQSAPHYNPTHNQYGGVEHSNANMQPTHHHHHQSMDAAAGGILTVTASSASSPSSPSSPPAPGLAGETTNNNNNAADASADAVPSAEKEVDYYLNPTELFRWINYRRWDGAKARVLSHPDECSTWIVSRHSGDGRVLWRHLPLHLVCMQSGSAKGDEGKSKSAEELAAQQQQVDELLDALLDVHPNAAASPDDQGMLPLHLAVANAESGLPNETVLGRLLLANPRAVEARDKYGRTPADILHEKATIASGTRYDAAVRALRRAQLTASTLLSVGREDAAREVAAIRAESDAERKANQLTILRLEEELGSIRRQTDDVANINKEEHEVRMDLENQMKALREQIKTHGAEVERIQSERDGLLDKNATLSSQVDEHDTAVANLQRSFEKERESQIEEIANLRSEASTSRAMADALEGQLRSRFTDEEKLSTAVGQLEAQTGKIKAEFDKERRQLLHERDDAQTESIKLRKTLDELTAKNLTMQGRVRELNKQLSNVLSGQSTLNAEHDRMVDSGVRYESDLLETMRIEREAMLSAIKKQKETLEQAFAAAEQIVEDSQAKEAELAEEAAQERRTGLEVVETFRKDFREIRASALERERRMHSEDLTGKGSAAVLGASSSYRVASQSIASRSSAKRSSTAQASLISKNRESSQKSTASASRGRNSLPSTIIERSRSASRLPASPSEDSEASHFSDETSAVTNPASLVDHEPRRKGTGSRKDRPNLRVDTSNDEDDDERTNPDGNLLRILDDRAEQASSVAPSRATRDTRDSSTYRSERRNPDRKGAASRPSYSRSTSRSHLASEDRSPHVKFAPESWREDDHTLEGSRTTASRTGDSKSSAGGSQSRSQNGSRSRSGSRGGRYSRHDKPSSPNSLSLDEYTQKSAGTAMGGGDYKQFSGMRAGMKNQLIRVADHHQSGYASRYGINIEREGRNDSFSKRG